MSFLTQFLMRFLRVIFESTRMTEVIGGVQSVTRGQSRLFFSDVFSLVISLNSKNESRKNKLTAENS
jgi:hypothetical protein